MRSKKILVVSGVPIFPVIGMHQIRILNQIKFLAKSHEVDFCFLYTKRNQKLETVRNLTSYCNSIYPLHTIAQSLFFRALAKFFLKRLFRLFAYPYDYFVASNFFTASRIAAIVKSQDYDIVLAHYWQASGFLKSLNSSVYKCIDTHYLVEENQDLLKMGKYSHIGAHNFGKLLYRELSLQNAFFKISDLIIVNSRKQLEYLNSDNRRKAIYVPNGQDLTGFLQLPVQDVFEQPNLLFYGALASQFNQKAVRRLIDKIFPLVSKNDKRIKLIIMGSSPPDWLMKRAEDNPEIIVTGFVQDVTEVFRKCFSCIIPLESGSGFRGRTVELMAAGIPVIGTKNALESVGITHGINALVSDNDEELAHFVLKMLHDVEMRRMIANNAKEFASNNYSLESAYGELNKYFLDINPRD